MGFLGDAAGFVGGVVDGAADAAGDGVGYVVGGAGDVAEGAADAVGADGIGDGIDGAADGVADTVNDGADTAGDYVEGGTETAGDLADRAFDPVADIGSDVIDGAFDLGAAGLNTAGGLVADGAGAVTGFFSGFFEGGGPFETICGAFNWVADNLGLIPDIGGVRGVLQLLLRGIGSIFCFIHTLIEGLFDLMLILTKMNGAELTAFTLGFGMIAVAAYFVLSIILTGQILLLPFETTSLFQYILLGWFGLMLVLYSVVNLLGGAVIAGSGVMLIMVAIGAEEDNLILPGVAAVLVGIPMFGMAYGLQKITIIAGMLGVLGMAAFTPQLEETA